jgi:hypothetical protein
MMELNAGQPEAPESKPRTKEEPENRLTEDGPGEIEGTKSNPFRKYLSDLCGPIRG